MQRYGLQDLHLSRAGWCSVSLRDMPPYWALKRPGKPLWCSSVSAPIQRQRALPGRNSSRVGRAFAVVRAAAIGPWPMAAALSPLEDWICRQGGLGTPAEWTVCGGKDGMRGRILRSFLQARPMRGRCVTGASTNHRNPPQTDANPAIWDNLLGFRAIQWLKQSARCCIIRSEQICSTGDPGTIRTMEHNRGSMVLPAENEERGPYHAEYTCHRRRRFYRV